MRANTTYLLSLLVATSSALSGCHRTHSTSVSDDAAPGPSHGGVHFVTAEESGGAVEYVARAEAADAAGGLMAPAPMESFGAAPLVASRAGEAPSSSGGAEKPAAHSERAQPQAVAGTLTAGAWDDLKNWDFWEGLYTRDQADGTEASLWNQLATTWWETRAAHRYALRLESPSGPVADAQVRLLDAEGETLWSARSDARGFVDLFEGFFGESKPGARIVVRAGNETLERRDVRPTGGERQVLQLAQNHAPARRVDVMFTIDTTGSMGDELHYIQREIQDVINRSADALGSAYSIRTSVNFYRDRGDEYVVRTFPFSTDLQQVQRQIDAQVASGGGDHPEAVDEALEASILKQEWTPEGATRLLFLVLDAEPHERADVRERLERSLRSASEQGVRIIPLMGSGYGKPAEYLMRNYAIATGGVFTFLTDHSGVGNAHMEPTTGPYEVEKLNDLFARLIVAYATGDR